MLKDAEVTTSLGVTFEPGYRVWLKEREKFWGVDFSFDFLKTTRPLLPKISTPEWKAQGSGTGVLTADVANDIFQETFVKIIMTIKQGKYVETGNH